MSQLLSDLNIKGAGSAHIEHTRSRDTSFVASYIKGAPIFEDELEEPIDMSARSKVVSRRLESLLSSDSPSGGKRGGTLSPLKPIEEILNNHQNGDSSTDTEWPWG